MESPQKSDAIRRNFLLWFARKAAIFLVVTILFGWFYAFASPFAFPTNKSAGFGYGILHGALMPIALPSLAIGRDVEIYDTDNSGRLYKIGYICGINLCGLAFFGPLFWRPKREAAQIIKSSSEKSR
jgi:hypothetical protein